MLDILRQKSRTVGIYFTFAAIIVVFGFTFGAISPDQACGGRPGTMTQAELVTVGGETIDTALLGAAIAVSENEPNIAAGESDIFFRMTRYRNLGFIGPMSGSAFGLQADETHPVPFVKLVDELVETRLVAEEARAAGLGVSDKELNVRLSLLIASFKDEKTGKFDQDRFRNYLAANGTTLARFEAFARDELLREKMIAMLVGEVGVSDAELDAAHRLSGEKVTLESISVDATTARPLVPVTEQEVATWLTANEEKVKAAYETRKATEFSTPKSWRLRGLRFEAPDVSLAADDAQKTEIQTARDAARARATEVLAGLRNPSAAPAAETAAPAAEKPAEDADKPAAEDAGKPAEPAAPLTTLDAFKVAAATHAPDDASKQNGGLLRETNYTEGELGGAPFGPAVRTAVTAAAPATLLDVVEGPDAFWVLYVEEVVEARTEPLEAVRAKLARTLLQEERAEVFKTSLANEVLAEARKSPTKALADVAKLLNEKYGVAAGGLEAREVAGFPRLQDNRTPFLFSLGGQNAKLVRAAFEASAEKPLLPEVYSFDKTGRLVVARFVSRAAPEAQEAEAREELRKALVTERQRALYRGWYDDLLRKKIASGEVVFTSDYARERASAEERYVAAGGVLPTALGKAEAEEPKAPAAAPAPAAPAPAPAK
jgi:hypothetical protein